MGKIDVHAEHSALARHVGRPALTFLHTAEAGGLVLLVAAVAALGWANSPWGASYFEFFHTPVEIRVGEFVLAPPGDAQQAHPTESASEAPAPPGEREDPSAELEHGMTLHHWINDGLMVIFFFVVGLEIKRELVQGELAGVRRAALPAAIALGGMIVPAGIYAAINATSPGGAIHGWGIPMATDIAFAVGVLALLGDRVPNAVRVLLLAFAIVDDIGAILVIAIFYTTNLSWIALGLAAGLLLLIVAMRWVGVMDIGPYFFVGILVWICTLCSGVHATIAGVALGLMAPSAPWFDLRRYSRELDRLQSEYNVALETDDEEMAMVILGRIEKLTQGTESVLDRLVRQIHPWSAFLVLPIFALANAGVVIDAESLKAAVDSPVLWGVLLGLLVGKPIGTTGLAWAAVKLNLVALPEGVNFRQLFGIGLLGGVGFTVALFITDLAFDSPTATDASKIGILAASLLAGIVGLIYLRTALRGGVSNDPDAPIELRPGH